MLCLELALVPFLVGRLTSNLQVSYLHHVLVFELLIFNLKPVTWKGLLEL